MMRRRTIATILFLSAAVLTVSGLDAIASGPGFLRSRNMPSGSVTTRTYRSYSVSPGNTTVSEIAGADHDAALASSWPSLSSPQSSGAVASPIRPSKTSKPKPSYMRADSKAMGRFGQ